MKYSYRVKANGRWYKPGEEIPGEKPIETATKAESKQDSEPDKPIKKKNK